MSGRRVHHHPSRFIDHNQFLVFEDNVQLNIFSDQIGGRRGWDSYSDMESAFQCLSRFLCRMTVYINKTTLDQPLNSGARKLLQLPDEEFIEPLRSRFLKTEV